MRIKDIELSNISKYRGELMGAAMLFIILFHVSLPRYDMFFGLRRMGNIGVDIFLFLSGIGLWFSWTKNHPPAADTDSPGLAFRDRKSTRLNSSHANISYAVFCLHKKNNS